MNCQQSREDLLAQKQFLEDELTSIKIQLDNARANLRATGKPADPEWYAKAMAARRIKGRQLSRINQELSERKKLRSNTLEALFVECARLTLEPSQFQAIWQMANLRYEKLTSLQDRQ